ncbi:zinc ribbon domain-containing protein [Eubacteriales bacterium OttesenSCG-928-K08]|nr:zinc ribbon domain-containing protein [Eubacteriales bacterium OttesenSCG-928-K08]
MSSSANIIFMAIPIFLLAMVLPLLLGLFVYRDAKSRGMNALLWAFIAALAPSLVGVIVYLVLRQKNEPFACAHCGQHVQSDFSSCPYCGTQLKYACTRCGNPVDGTWKFCTCCGEMQPEGRPAGMREIKTESRNMKILLACLISIPVLMMLLVLLSGIWVMAY